jgi:hypothetical protein
MRRFCLSIQFAHQGHVLTSRLLLSLFLIAQIFDGLFTYVVVRAFGRVAEANILLEALIGLVGPEPAIFGAKVLAAGCGLFLYHLGLDRVLGVLTLFYGVVAIGPWLVTLHHI